MNVPKCINLCYFCFKRAYPRYESAHSMYAEIGSQYGQMDVLMAMTKVVSVTGDIEQVHLVWKIIIDTWVKAVQNGMGRNRIGGQSSYDAILFSKLQYVIIVMLTRRKYIYIKNSLFQDIIW